MVEKNKKSEKTKMRQTSIFDAESVKTDGASKDKKPPTDLMKIVAKAVPVKQKMKGTFSAEEIREILDDKKKKEEQAEFKKEQKRIKKLVLEMEATNRDKLIFYKSSLNGEFYKALDTSALYYCYRLATRMGRKSNIMIDKDRYSKALYVASIADIDKFVKQFEELEGSKPEITLDGIYIFPLKKPLEDADIQMLRQTEKTRRDKMHDILKPKKMAPAVYQQILMIIRQLAPKSEKFRAESINYRMVGDEMLKNLRDILVIYADFTNGKYSRAEAGMLVFSEIGKIKASLVILGETRKWGVAPLVSAGKKVNILEQLIEKDLKKDQK